jgi:hypothetical protein
MRRRINMECCPKCKSINYSATYCFSELTLYCECKNCGIDFEIQKTEDYDAGNDSKVHSYLIYPVEAKSAMLYLRNLIFAIESCPDTTIGGKALVALDEAKEFLGD